MIKKWIQPLMNQQMATLAIAGLAKNVGKTTVLNALIQEMKDSCRLGLVSLGVDGEERDAWSGRPKPLIHIAEGMWVATAAPYLDIQAGNWEIISDTGITTILGQIFIAIARRDTNVKLAGINSIDGIQKIKRILAELGVQLLLVDGAYDRKGATSPDVTDASIVVVGASMSSTLQEVLKKTEEWYHLFQLPVCKDQQIREALTRALNEHCVYAVVDQRIERLPVSTFFQLFQSSQWRKDHTYQAIAIPGALSERMLTRWIEQKIAIPLILPDATHLFISLSSFRRYTRLGGVIQFYQPIQILAVFVNPVSPEGFSFLPDEMKREVARICHPVPVMDVVRDGKEDGGEPYATT